MPFYSICPSTSGDSYSQSQGNSNLMIPQQSQEYGEGDERRASFKLGDPSDSDFDDFFPSLNRNASEGDQSQSQSAQQVEANQDDDDNLDEFFSNL